MLFIRLLIILFLVLFLLWLAFMILLFWLLFMILLRFLRMFRLLFMILLGLLLLFWILLRMIYPLNRHLRSLQWIMSMSILLLAILTNLHMLRLFSWHIVILRHSNVDRHPVRVIHMLDIKIVYLKIILLQINLVPVQDFHLTSRHRSRPFDRFDKLRLMFPERNILLGNFGERRLGSVW